MFGRTKPSALGPFSSVGGCPKLDPARITECSCKRQGYPQDTGEGVFLLTGVPVLGGQGWFFHTLRQCE